MKRVLTALLVFALLLSGRAYAVESVEADAIELNAPCALLMEKVTGEILYEKNAHERVFPASVTKIMTLLLIIEDLEAGKFALTDTVTASARAASFGGSCVFLEEGEQMSVDEMLKCIAIVSANDCAVAMAEFVSGSEELFVRRMNERAAELGMEETRFSTCTGLYDDAERHYTTAYDVALMSRALISHDMVKNYTTVWMDSIRNGEFGLSNTNKLVYWYPDCTGLKTGYTSGALYCLSATAEREGTEYIAVVMHCDSSDSRNNDAKKLLNYGFATYRLERMYPEYAPGNVAVTYGRADTVALEYGGEEYALLEKNTEPLSYELTKEESVTAPVEAGQRLGTLTVRRGEQTVAELPVLAAESVECMGYFGFVKLLLLSLICG